MLKFIILWTLSIWNSVIHIFFWLTSYSTFNMLIIMTHKFFYSNIPCDIDIIPAWEWEINIDHQTVLVCSLTVRLCWSVRWPSVSVGLFVDLQSVLVSSLTISQCWSVRWPSVCVGLFVDYQSVLVCLHLFVTVFSVTTYQSHLII